MTKITYGLVDATARTVRLEAFDDFQDAKRAAGLNPGSVDHGSIGERRSVVVDEFGLFDPADQQHYFVAGRQLFAGNAVLYAYDQAGETIDFTGAAVLFVSARNAEAMIEAGQISRPGLTIDGEAIWQWPQPAPADMAAAREWARSKWPHPYLKA